MTDILRNRWLTLIAALVLGGFFVYAALSHKITDPPDFSKAVLNYKLVPWYAVNMVAIFLPWLELLGGIAVISGLGRRGGALTLLLLCAVFISALSYNLYRGHPTICGCFNSYEEGLKWTDEYKYSKMRTEIILDVGLLILAAQVLYSSVAAKRPYSSPGR